ncbi:hypothetical protein O181_048105 [Austropuccinia psidii MF-1]|uniref:Integrase catalytic domain-containing protein n=1 Tax=Austropuccinia psidii MF-1 TaxID=1389203 RepID=A0A9Q3HNW0_9BASI|nr:hypothetical protein [Austropuccinia psidii MF-1]
MATRSGRTYNMSDRKFDIDDLRAALSVNDSGAVLKRQVEIDRLGEGITPRLTSDGLTFHRWSRSLNHLIERTHQVTNYFGSDAKDTNRERNAEIRSLIEKSIDASLKSLIEDEDKARQSFACLCRQFEKLLWSHVMNLFDDIVNATEASENLVEAYTATKNTVTNLKLAIGSTWTNELLIAIFFHHRNNKYFHEILNAMDTKISIKKSINIKSNDILQIAQRFQRRTTNSPLSGQPSIMAASTSQQQTPNRQIHQGQRFGNPSTSNQARPPNNRVPISQQSESWARHFLSPWFPCLHYYEWGHWAQDCPRKKAGKLAVEDPRIKNPNASLQKLPTFSHTSIAEVEVEEGDPFVSAIESIPENKSLVLLDSGATHHVTGDKNLFVSYCKINLMLSVASARQHQVEGKGTIRLAFPSGDLLLKEVLHCPDIPGIVISVGKFMKNDGEVRFKKGRFVLSQRACTYDSVLCCDCWFLMITPTAFCNSISSSNQEFNELLHRRLAHVLIQTIKHMQTLNCVEGLPKVPVSQNVRLCKACSLAKSKHTPFRPKSRNIVTQPGDVIVTDLMGPFPQSFDKKLYGMIIQDHFSSLVTFYPLKRKSEALQLLMHWVTQFKNLTPHSIKRVRTDNSGKFMTNSLKNFFTQQGIVHETIVPYEHHQAGKIERTNRTIAKAARSMIFNSGLQPVIWPYAFRHSCWVFNWVVHSGQNMTPYELMTGRKPNLAPLRVFGCKAYVHNINHRKNLTLKSRQLVHLGIAENSQGWVFWDEISQSTV